MSQRRAVGSNIIIQSIGGVIIQQATLLEPFSSDGNDVVMIGQITESDGTTTLNTTPVKAIESEPNADDLETTEKKQTMTPVLNGSTGSTVYGGILTIGDSIDSLPSYFGVGIRISY